MINKKLALKQFTVMGFTDGLIDMIGEKEADDEQFVEIWKDLKYSCNMLAVTLRKEHTLSKKDIKTVKIQIEKLKEKHIPNGKFSSMFACSFCMDLLTEQSVLCTYKKKAAFEKVFNVMKRMIKHFDKNNKYDDDKGMNMAEDYRRL